MHEKLVNAPLTAVSGFIAACVICFATTPQVSAQPAPDSVCSLQSLQQLTEMTEARELEQAGRFAESLQKYSDALGVLQQSCGERHHFVPTVLSSRAMIAVELGQYPAAEEDLELAETIARSLEPHQPLLVARVLYTRGSLRMRLDNLSGAEADLKQTLELLAAEPDVPADYEIRTRSTLAGVYYMMGKPQEALNEFTPVVEHYRANPSFPDFANSLGNLGEIYRAIGDVDAAARYFEESIEIYDTEGGLGHIGSALPMNNLALTYSFRGDYEQAEKHLNRALEIRREHFGDVHPQVADTLLNLGAMAVANGQYGKAFGLFESALDIQNQIYDGDHESIADSLGSIGAVLTALASFEEAIGYLEKAVAMRRRLHGSDYHGNAADLSNLSVAYRNVSRFDAAESAAAESIELLAKGYGSDNLSMYGMYVELGRVYSATGRSEEALTLLRKGLELATETLGERHVDVARLRANIGRLLLLTGDAAAAEAALEGAHASLAGQAGRPEASAEVYTVLSEFERARGDERVAIYFGKRAVNDLQSLRAGAVGLDAALQRRYLASIEKTYRDLADLLIDAGRLAEAQQVLAMLKEEEYSDFIRLRSAARPTPNTLATYTVEEQAWQNRYSELNGELAAVGEALADLQERQRELASQGQSLSAGELERLEALKARQREFRSDFDGQLSALRAYFAEIGGEPAIEFGRKDLDSLQALQGVLRRIERASGERVVLLTYLMTGSKLRILLTSSNTLLHRDVDVIPQELNRLVFNLRQSVQDTTSDPKPLAHKLYAFLVEPVRADLDVIKADVLLTSLDGALRYLPMGVLHDGQAYLAEHYALGVFTPAARLNLERRPDTFWTAAGMGVTQPADGFLSLPSVGMELDRIVRESSEVSASKGNQEESDSGILDGRIWLDSAFTAQSLVDASVAGFEVIHIASHFIFKPGNERDSFLLLGDGNRLTLDEFVADAYQFEHLDLLTLSACDTALGGDTASGKEIEGFGALAQNKGASAVLATLWPVADDSTAEIMAGFYEFRQVHKMSKVQALRAVKRAFIKGDDAFFADLGRARGASTDDSRVEDLAHPYYWAPFILMGNWQ